MIADCCFVGKMRKPLGIKKKIYIFYFATDSNRNNCLLTLMGKREKFSKYCC